MMSVIQEASLKKSGRAGERGQLSLEEKKRNLPDREEEGLLAERTMCINSPKARNNTFILEIKQA